MSWHPGGSKALWIEGLRGSDRRRMQVVQLPDYQPAEPVAARSTPDAMPYASADLSQLAALVAKSRDIDVRVYGRASGHIEYRRTPARIEKIYADFTDDGHAVYSGRETLRFDPRGNSTYTADIRLAGPRPGVMNLTMTFGPLYGDPPSQLIFAPDVNGKPVTHGYAEYAGTRIEADSLAP
jgi:hypothetical protein